jgi:hypothetical protein
LLNTIGARIIAQPNDYYLAGIDQPPNVLERTAQHRGHFRHAQQVGHLYSLFIRRSVARFIADEPKHNAARLGIARHERKVSGPLPEPALLQRHPDANYPNLPRFVAHDAAPFAICSPSTVNAST